MSSLRSIEAIGLTGVEPRLITAGRPIVEWVDPTTLKIDAEYQRDLSEPSIRLIRKIIGEFDWARFKAPLAVLTDNGLELIDGQHTAIAAASHPGITEIPVMVVEAAEQSNRAAAFLGINRDRLNVSQPMIYKAAIVAKEPDALAVARICDAIGIEVLTVQPRAFKPKQTVAVTALKSLVRGQTEETAVRVLVVLANAGLAPIKADHIKAVEILLAGDDFKGEITDDRLTTVIASQDIGVWEKEGKTFAATHGVTLSRALATVWFKARNKRIGGTETKTESSAPAAPPPPRPTAQPKPPSPDGIKRDERPELLAHGWRAGPHVRRCARCDERFLGQQQATSCADCAYAQETAA